MKSSEPPAPDSPTPTAPETEAPVTPSGKATSSGREKKTPTYWKLLGSELVLRSVSLSKATKVFPAQGWEVEVLGGGPQIVQGCGWSCLGPRKPCSLRQGKELQKKLKEQGSFAALEVYVSKKSKRQDKQNVAGGWYNKTRLEKEGWTSQLA